MRALVAIVALGGCVSVAPVAPVAPIRLDTGGIEVVGTGQRIDFGRDRAGVIQTMTRLRGRAPDQASCVDPSRTAYVWDDDVTLVFRNNAFAGWAALDPALSYDGRFTFGQACIGPD